VTEESVRSMVTKEKRTHSRLRALVDDSHLGRSSLVGLERFLGGFTPLFVVLVGLLLLALIGLVDAVTGSFGVTVFYLVPIGLVTFARGRWVGTIMAATAAVAWMVVELRTGTTSFAEAVTYLNLLSRFYVYEAVVILVAPMRDIVRWEREIAAREVEAAEDLRVLQELREALALEAEGPHARLEALAREISASHQDDHEQPLVASTRP
jgi:hypothetical protein